MPTACFTGHRKLGKVYYNHINPAPEWLTLRQNISTVLPQLYEMPYYIDRYISGLAIGVDMLAAECVHDFKMNNHNHDITLVAAIPFPSQANRWPVHTRQHWSTVVAMCNDVQIISEDPYSPEKMQIRNEWMVNQSDYVIAVWNGIKSGGTWNCMNYAISQGKSILAFQPNGVSWSIGWVSSELL